MNYMNARASDGTFNSDFEGELLEADAGKW